MSYVAATVSRAASSLMAHRSVVSTFVCSVSAELGQPEHAPFRWTRTTPVSAS